MEYSHEYLRSNSVDNRHSANITHPVRVCSVCNGVAISNSEAKVFLCSTCEQWS